MERFRKQYTHPFKLFAAALYANADAMHKGKPPILTWESPEAKKQQAERKA